MAKTRKSAKQGGHQKRSKRVSLAYLDKLISEATVDCYNESEQITGIFTLLEENLVVPFTTTLLGMEVTVERIEGNTYSQAAFALPPAGSEDRAALLYGKGSYR